MRRVGKLKEPFLSFGNLYLAFRKGWKATKTYEAQRFYFHLERELLKLQEELTVQTYQPSDYTYFPIHDPKEREVAVAPFRDRIVHHALVNILEPIYGLRFIFDSYATRKEKGVHKAILRAQQFLKHNLWFLKMEY